MRYRQVRRRALKLPPVEVKKQAEIASRLLDALREVGSVVDFSVTERYHVNIEIAVKRESRLDPEGVLRVVRRKAPGRWRLLRYTSIYGTLRKTMRGRADCHISGEIKVGRVRVRARVTDFDSTKIIAKVSASTWPR